MGEMSTKAMTHQDLKPHSTSRSGCGKYIFGCRISGGYFSGYTARQFNGNTVTEYGFFRIDYLAETYFELFHYDTNFVLSTRMNKSIIAAAEVGFPANIYK